MPLSGGETGCRSSIILPYLQDSQFDCWYNLVMKFPVFTDLGGETWRILRFADENDKRWSAFNPSIAYSPKEGYVVLFRSSNYFLDPVLPDATITVGASVKSNMWLGNLDADWQIDKSSLRVIDFSDAGLVFKRGAEDGRLYWRDDSWEITAGLKEPEVPLPRIGTFRLDGLKARLKTLHSSGTLYDVEKNWMAVANADASFDFIYNPVSTYVEGVGPSQVREVDESVRHVRGGSQLWDLGDWGYLAIIHEAVVTPCNVYIPRYFAYKTIRSRDYVHRFARYNKDGVLVGLSDKFKLSDALIEFAAGLVVTDDKEVIVSYGYKDVASYLGKIKLDKVLKMIKDV